MAGCFRKKILGTDTGIPRPRRVIRWRTSKATGNFLPAITFSMDGCRNIALSLVSAQSSTNKESNNAIQEESEKKQQLILSKHSQNPFS